MARRGGSPPVNICIIEEKCLGVRVPEKVTTDIARLLAQLGKEAKDVRFVQHRPEPESEQNDCFPTVQHKIDADGGKMILGWQIWQTVLLVEAEFHAVWEGPNGEWFDLTPKPFELEQIYFLSDSTLSYNGAQRNNVRLNITSNSIVDEYIAIHDIIFSMMNRGQRAFQYKLTLKGREAQAHQYLNNMKPILEGMAFSGLTRQNQCPCGQGKKYKACHGKKLSRILNEYK